MIKVKDVIEQKQQELYRLQSQSSKALDLVTSTINQLKTVNEKIDVTINEIAEQEAKLQATKNELGETKLHNAKIIDKFRNLINDGE